jgi:hypothetical protein
MNRWQPIETAPRDGTLIIGDFGEGWISSCRCFKNDAPNEVDYWVDAQGLDFNYGNGIPVRWIPMPDSPENHLNGDTK